MNEELIVMTAKNRLMPLLLAALIAAIAAPVAAQSPNTAAMIVVVDKTDAAVKDAEVSVVKSHSRYTSLSICQP